MEQMNEEPETQDEYDFSGGQRGRYAQGMNLIAPGTQHPPFRSTVGNLGQTIEPVTKIVKRFRIVDEITQIQSDDDGKVIILQKVQFDDGKIEIRLGYYIIGKKPKMLGKWVWGQYATFMPVGDFAQLVEEARKKGWLPEI